MAGLELDTLHLKVPGLLPVGTMLTGKAWGTRGPLHPRERLSRNHGCCEGPGRKRGSCWGLAVSWSHQGLRVGVQIRQLEGRLPAQVPAAKWWRRWPVPSASRSRQRVDKMAPVPLGPWSHMGSTIQHVFPRVYGGQSAYRGASLAAQG